MESSPPESRWLPLPPAAGNVVGRQEFEPAGF